MNLRETRSRGLTQRHDGPRNSVFEEENVEKTRALAAALLIAGLWLLAGCALIPGADAVATADPREGYPPLEVTLDATGSSSRSGAIATYAWDLGDGTSANESTVTHTYAEKGTHRVTLTVTDTDGRTDSGSITVRVLNLVPHAEFLFSPFGGPRDFPVTFDASRSHDPDGSIVEYRWDFGDGTTDQGLLVKHIFPFVLEYMVTLTVVDEDGTENNAVRKVPIRGCDTCG